MAETILKSSFPSQIASDSEKAGLEYGLKVARAIEHEWFKRDSGATRFYSNRDEYHRRPSALAHRWTTDPNITAGQDLEQLGTWMGVTRSGRWAVVTNFREATKIKESKKSRGHLTTGFLSGRAVSEKAVVGVFLFVCLFVCPVY